MMPLILWKSWASQPDDLAGGIPLSYVPGDCMHQMGLAQTNATIKEQWVKVDLRRVSHPASGGIGELIRFAHYKTVESITGI